MLINRFSHFIDSCLKEQVLPAVSSQQKKCLVVAAFIFSCIILYTIITRRCISVTVTYSYDSPQLNKKVDNAYSQTKRGGKSEEVLDQQQRPDNADQTEINTPQQEAILPQKQGIRFNEQKEVNAQKQDKNPTDPIDVETQPKPKAIVSKKQDAHSDNQDEINRQPSHDVVSDKKQNRDLDVQAPILMPAKEAPKKKSNYVDLYGTLQSTDDLKRYWEEVKGQKDDDKVKDLFNFAPFVDSQAYRQNLKSLLSSLTESEIQHYASQKIDVFHLTNFFNEEGVAFLFHALNRQQIKALFQGLFAKNDLLPDGRILINCIEGIDSYTDESEKHKMFQDLIGMLYLKHYNNNRKALGEYLEISSYRDGKPDSPRTKAMTAFFHHYVINALEYKQFTTTLLNLIDQSEPLLIGFLKKPFLDTLTPEQQGQLKKWAKAYSPLFHTIFERDMKG